MMMTDPMDALQSLQLALDRREVRMEACVIYPDLRVFLDWPSGELRFTYALVVDGKVQAIALLITADQVQAAPCFQMGWATRDSARGKGLATEISRKAIEEFCAGMAKSGLRRFCLEAVVGIDNEHSKKIASKLLSDAPIEIVDEICGEPALQYLRLVSL